MSACPSILLAGMSGFSSLSAFIVFCSGVSVFFGAALAAAFKRAISSLRFLIVSRSLPASFFSFVTSASMRSAAS